MIGLALLLGIQAAPESVVRPDPATAARVERVLARAPIVDGHNDLAWEIREGHGGKVESLDLNADTSALAYALQTDIPRLKRGGVGGQFWSVWTPPELTGPRAVELTLEQIDLVRRVVAANPRSFELAGTAADIRRISRAGRIASLLGVEGGHGIDGRLSVLRQYHMLGVRYMTLTHTRSLAWADASTDDAIARGLTPFGRQVVAEMNRIGMIADISHVSDDTARAVLAATCAPVIASHSSARALAKAPRNLPDDLLRAVGANGGVVMVNFYPGFLSDAWRGWDAARTAEAERLGVPADLYGPKAPLPLAAWDRAHPEPRVTVATVADHVDHIARVAGRDHVGLGGDFDGIGGAGPIGLKGVDGYPLLLAELARRGWSDADLARLAQGNVLRVLEQVERVAAALRGAPPVDAIDPLSRP